MLLEFKRTTGERREVAKTFCGMLNGRGGVVLIGVHDDGRITGQQVNAGTQTDIAAELGRIEPAAMPSFETTEVAADRSVIALTVPGGSGRSCTRGDRTSALAPSRGRCRRRSTTCWCWSVCTAATAERTSPRAA